jgi:serine/threonine protein kinase
MPAPPEGFVEGRTLVTNETAEVFEVGRAGHTFVCKRLGRRMRSEPAMWDVLRREAEILRVLDGRGAPRLEASGDDGHGPFVVMERIEGAPKLEEAIDGATLDAADERRVWAALAEVHAAGVVHGDVSPPNVLFTASKAVLVDFGFARFVQDARIYEGGTALYFAPEVARGELRDMRSDVFSLAAVILHGRTHVPPRRQTSLPPLLIEAGSEAISAPPDLSACLAFDPAARPADARAVLAALRTTD